MIDTFAIRCSILRLAFSGKVTSQNELDGTAREMLHRIAEKKTIVQTENTPYEIPKSWAWVKLDDLYDINPKVEASDDNEAAFIPMEQISAGFNRSFTFDVQRWNKASKNHTKFADGDVAFAKISPCFENRKSFIAEGLPNGIGGGTTELIILRQPEMLPEYTYYLLQDQRFINTGSASYKGIVGQQRVQSDIIKKYLVPVAPYKEQIRIVESIKQAFEVLDTIDDLQSRYLDNLSVLKSKLIDAAIRGQLTEQLPEDGTAEELYRQIQAEKQNLIKLGKLKKEKELPEIKDDEKPFEIPLNWKWVRLGSLGTTITGSTPTKALAENYGGNYPFFKPSDLDAGMHISQPSEFLTELGKNSTRQVKNRSILVCCIGSIGKAAIIDTDGSFNQQINALTPFLCDSDYILYSIYSRLFQNQLNQGSTATTISIINKSKFDVCILPLPPLSEQRRIVDKLNECLSLIDRGQ